MFVNIALTLLISFNSFVIIFAQLSVEPDVPIKDWYCGNDAFTTALSYSLSGICPRYRSIFRDLRSN
ncbi:hypothetical protein DdX_02770 [Ditylenchus destructor]|uniref:Uncharacterized protein n=1 Tax=Ditylenchus destructor TaxID=166010 RepID=A0AAD4R6C1_9BILA|nr:hypothetical protein DdX_02770 [Ditylenchus destructor]